MGYLLRTESVRFFSFVPLSDPGDRFLSNFVFRIFIIQYPAGNYNQRLRMVLTAAGGNGKMKALEEMTAPFHQKNARIEVRMKP